MRPFFVTTAISYPNGRPHVGHAYEVIATDCIARWRRLAGDRVFFMTGTDEYGLKMAQAARDAGVTPLALADANSAEFRRLSAVLGVSHDRFIRTTEAAHAATVQALWERMAAAGDLYPSRYEGWYSVRDEAFYGEEELVDGPDGARLSPQGTPVEWTAEESWFFRLSAYAERLLALYEAHPGFVRPESRLNEVAQFVRGGLRDLSVSRTTFDWGVAVPGAPGHVMYVWLDALTNYLTATGWPGEGAPGAPAWPAQLHVVGKDVVRFHAVYWPAFLMSAGLAVPEVVFGHGFVLNRGQKMSKSAGNAADPFVLADAFGVDALRYFLLREVPFGADGSYSEEAIVARANADLANGIGNLAQRVLTLIARNCGGVMPGPGVTGPAEVALLAEGERVAAAAMAAMERLAIHEALAAVWELVRAGDAYVAAEQPWALAKVDRERMAVVLHHAADVARRVAILAAPAMPGSCARVLDLLGVEPGARDHAALGQAMAGGAALPPPAGVFPRLEVPA